MAKSHPLGGQKLPGKRMAFKRSAVRSRLSPPKVLKTIGFQHFFLFRSFFGWIFRPLEYSANLSHSRGVVMARISMRNVQKSPVSEYFDLFLSSAAARGVKDKTLSTYKQHFHSISKRLDVTLPLNRLNTAELDKMVLSMREEGLSASSINSYTRTLKVFYHNQIQCSFLENALKGDAGFDNLLLR